MTAVERDDSGATVQGLCEPRYERAREALSLFAALEVTRYAHQPLMSRVWAWRANLTAYDAVYVALAEALPAPLLTLDRKLAAAANQLVQIEMP